MQPFSGRGSSVSDVMASLQTEVDNVKGFWSLFGFGNRVIVRPDEVHVVVGHGLHGMFPTQETAVFGQTAGAPAIYWLNRGTQVVKLKTNSFTVEISGEGDRGIELLDKNRVAFRAWAHVEAKLDSRAERVQIAAQRVGIDVTGLVHSIISETTTQLIVAAASMSLDEIITNMQRLGDVATDRVNATLAELGYDLAFLRVIRLAGEAYEQIVKQATAEVTAQTTIGTNAAELRKLEDVKGRERREAELAGTTLIEVRGRQLAAEREVENATTEQQEALAARRHQLRLATVERDQAAAQREHGAALAQVELDRTRATAEQVRDAELAKARAAAEAQLALAQAQADAERERAIQTARIAREGEAATAHEEIARQRALAAAAREREVREIEVSGEAQATTARAEAAARALSIETTARTEAELAEAKTKAEAATITAQAAQAEAAATKARQAAAGLAEAEVAAAQVAVEEKRVAVVRAEGLAQVEIEQARKAAEIEAQRLLADLYAAAPVLVDLERARMANTLQLELARIETSARLAAFQAIAPQFDIRVIGGGDRLAAMIQQVVAVSGGVQVLGEEVPLVGNLLNSLNGNGTGSGLDLLTGIGALIPRLQAAMSEVNPRVFSSLSLNEVLEQAQSLLAGETDLMTAIDQIRKNANFTTVGTIPVGQILALFGVDLASDGKNGATKEVVPVELEDKRK